MTRRTTQVMGVALALLVGALYLASPLCLMPVCAGSMATTPATRMAASCEPVPAQRIGTACDAPKPRAVVATADRPAFPVADAVTAPLFFQAPASSAAVLVAAAEPPPPDPLGDSSRLRL